MEKDGWPEGKMTVVAGSFSGGRELVVEKGKKDLNEFFQSIEGKV